MGKKLKTALKVADKVTDLLTAKPHVVASTNIKKARLDESERDKTCVVCRKRTNHKTDGVRHCRARPQCVNGAMDYM